MCMMELATNTMTAESTMGSQRAKSKVTGPPDKDKVERVDCVSGEVIVERGDGQGFWIETCDGVAKTKGGRGAGVPAGCRGGRLAPAVRGKVRDGTSLHLTLEP